MKKKLWVSFPANHDNALHKALRKSCLVLHRIGLQKKERKAEAKAQDGGSSLINSPLCASEGKVKHSREVEWIWIYHDE